MLMIGASRERRLLSGKWRRILFTDPRHRDSISVDLDRKAHYAVMKHAPLPADSRGTDEEASWRGGTCRDQAWSLNPKGGDQKKEREWYPGFGGGTPYEGLKSSETFRTPNLGLFSQYSRTEGEGAQASKSISSILVPRPPNGARVPRAPSATSAASASPGAWVVGAGGPRGRRPCCRGVRGGVVIGTEDDAGVMEVPFVDELDDSGGIERSSLFYES